MTKATGDGDRERGGGGSRFSELQDLGEACRLFALAVPLQTKVREGQVSVSVAGAQADRERGERKKRVVILRNMRC